QSLESIPNNVDLGSDRRLQRALEQWQPNFLSWWKEVGPEGFQAHKVYLRTAISVEPNGWAHFDFVRMPEYRWGIFLDPKQERKIGFGDNEGQPVWEEVPGEHRNALRRIIVTQADTEPASVEQQRLLGKTCPSMYDLRNIFQVNVEEGRHLWAMVYLLHRYFGRDGREEADELLARRSGSGDKPRILNTFNEPIDDWLSFFMFTMFTDRDGKYQLSALAQSGFDPLPRGHAGRAQGGRPDLPDGSARDRQAGRAGSAAQERDERGPPRRVREGLPARPRSLEQDPAEGRREGNDTAPAASPVPPQRG